MPARVIFHSCMVNYKLKLMIYDAEEEIIARLPMKRVDQPGQEASFAFHLCSAVTALTAS